MASLEGFEVRNTFVNVRELDVDIHLQTLRRTKSEPGIKSEGYCIDSADERKAPAAVASIESNIGIDQAQVDNAVQTNNSALRRRKRWSKKERERRKRSTNSLRPAPQGADEPRPHQDDVDREWVHVVSMSVSNQANAAIDPGSPLAQVLQTPQAAQEVQIPQASQLSQSPQAEQASQHTNGDSEQRMGFAVSPTVAAAVGVAAAALAGIAVRKWPASWRAPWHQSKDLAIPTFPEGHGTLFAVGSTGNGKSCLLNFLLNPSKAHCLEPRAQAFKTGETNVSCTGQCHIEKCSGFTFIDSAGVNESHEADLPHMIDVAKTLRNVTQVSAFALVLKYRDRIDQQWKDTILYYCNLVGKHTFVSNLVIILTHYDVAKLRTNPLQTPEVHKNILSEIQSSIKTLLGLPEVPQIFAIDCLPEDSDRSTHEKTRLEILRYVAKQQPVDVSGTLVEKTTKLKQLDEQRVKTLEGEINQLNVRFKMADTVPDAIKEKLKNSSHEEARLNVDIREAQKRMDSLRTNELVLSRHHVENRPYQITQSYSEDVYVEAPCDIRELRFFSKDVYLDASFKDIRNRSVRVCIRKSALPSQHYRRYGKRQGFCFEIKLWSYKEDFYASNISSLENSIESKKCELKEIASLQRTMLEKHPEAAEEANKLRAEIQDREQQICTLRCSKMTVEEAESRLHELDTRSKL
eukprot:TRINITY_DN39592_c0_g1_i1.p1 TRINITY_DN39592_c0_g1~~TRINITY_DN39592_c0_g1_i1.p1  ORF type:complete len:714 (+),score=80.30 TRINITY_DN39592_c0_g1_i1:74-2143(+)